jgi:hypothetical protein
MQDLQSSIQKGLEAHRQLDHPKPDTTVFSIYAPMDLVDAFKRVCQAQGEAHPLVTRQLMAQYVEGALEDMDTVPQDGQKGGSATEERKRHEDAAEV